MSRTRSHGAGEQSSTAHPLSRVAILWRPGTLSEDAFKHMLQETQAIARSLGVHIQVVEAAKVEDFDAAFSAMAQDRADVKQAVEVIE